MCIVSQIASHFRSLKIRKKIENGYVWFPPSHPSPKKWLWKSKMSEALWNLHIASLLLQWVYLLVCTLFQRKSDDKPFYFLYSKSTPHFCQSFSKSLTTKWNCSSCKNNVIRPRVANKITKYTPSVLAQTPLRKEKIVKANIERRTFHHDYFCRHQLIIISGDETLKIPKSLI